MADIAGTPANFWVQSNALLRKNLTFQKRRMCANVVLILIPVFFIAIFSFTQHLVEYFMDKATKNMNCDQPAPSTLPPQGEKQAASSESCPIASPKQWPPLIQLPSNKNRAVRSSSFPFTDLPDESCRTKENLEACPVTILMTGSNQTFAQNVAGYMLPRANATLKSSGTLPDWSEVTIGSEFKLVKTYYNDWAFLSPDEPIYILQRTCDVKNFSIKAVLQQTPNTSIPVVAQCLKCLQLWRNSSGDVNNQLFKGFKKGNEQGQSNGIMTAYDFLNTDANTFNVTIWYNATGTGGRNEPLLRIPRLVNMASNAYLKFLKGPKTKMLFEFVKEMPKGYTSLRVDFASMIGTTFFVWTILLLFPIILTSLVYEKQERLRVMMKMHGLGDGPYWTISYTYFLGLSILYIICFVGFGSINGLNFFLANTYSLQFTFYFLYVNLQLALAFLASSMFSNTKSAAVIAYLYAFGSGLMGANLFDSLIQEPNGLSKGWVIFLELYPAFSLHRGISSFASYAAEAKVTGNSGMGWGSLGDRKNGMKEVLIIITFEWLVLLLLSFYIDQVVTCGKSPLFFMKSSGQNKGAALRTAPSLQNQGSKAFGDVDKPDVTQEREKVESLMAEAKYTSHVVICDNIKKVYPGRDGNPEKFAVRGLSLALPPGECFGMLGPSGAGKTSFIEMMIGLTKPTTGTAYVQGLNIVTQMNEIYNCIGVCPQHDLLWATLTGREHLLFYGRLKNLKGSILTQAVEDSLKNLNLFNGGVADKQSGQYSGGMKRRLSVAISLIGNPIAVYMDEPSTGLDPASRNTLWNVIKHAKQGRVIILTTHSMEEAEFLCDRLGIFVDGKLSCIGNPKELKGRYGGSYVFTITTNACHEREVEDMVAKLSPNAHRVYHLAGTQKFELPKKDVRIADVFETVERAKKVFTVYAWGLADTTLEDVFIKVASTPRKLQSNVLSRDNLIT